MHTHTKIFFCAWLGSTAMIALSYLFFPITVLAILFTPFWLANGFSWELCQYLDAWEHPVGHPQILEVFIHHIITVIFVSIYYFVTFCPIFLIPAANPKKVILCTGWIGVWFLGGILLAIMAFNLLYPMDFITD